MREEGKGTTVHASKGHQGRGQGQGHGQAHGNHDHHERRKDRLPQQQQQQQKQQQPLRQQKTATSKVKKTPGTRAKAAPQSESSRASLQQQQQQQQLDAQAENGLQGQSGSPEPEAAQVVKQEAEADAEGNERGNGAAAVEKKEEAEEEEKGEEEEQKGRESVDGGRKSASPPPVVPANSPPPPRKLTQVNYDVRSFNSSLNEFVDVLSDPRYQEMQGQYPVEELMSVVSLVSASVQEYKEHTQRTNHQLQALRDAMKTVKENLHLTTTRQAFDLAAEEQKTVEELELEAKLTQLNATLAQAHAEVAEANKLSAETSQRALQASVSAQQARHEAQRIQEEIQLKAERERKKKEEEERRMEEEKRRQREEERKREEEQRAEERRRKKLEEEHSSLKIQEEMTLVDHWKPHLYTVDDGSEGGDLQCVIRGAHFNQSDVRCDIIAQQEGSVTYGDQEELISRILVLRSTDDSKQAPAEPIYVAIPYTARLPTSREPVVKAKVEGCWTDLATHEVVLEGHKEYKFAQAKVELFTQLLVMSRFKRDYLCVQHPRRLTKLTSSYDHRVVLTIPKNTFPEKVQLVMQVQPVDSVTVNEFRAHAPHGKHLLTSSHILHLDWYTDKQDPFGNAINITLPCPPNPAKAKKLALLKKQKEDKLKSNKPAFNLEDLNKPAKKTPAAKQTPGQNAASSVRGVGVAGALAAAAAAEEEEDAVPQRQTKWYMGQYGQTEDDENDQLCLLVFRGGRWHFESQVTVVQAKLDLVAFDIDSGYERLMVLRTRTDVEEDGLKHMAQGLTEQLSHRAVRVLFKRREDDPYDICCHVVPTSSLERAERAMKAEGYTEEADHNAKDHVASLREGDTLMLEIQGNLKLQEDSKDGVIRLPYNSNLPTHAAFHLTEVNKYLQKNFDVYRGKVRVVRRSEIFNYNPKLRKQADEECAIPMYKTDVIFEVDVDIPKYHVEPDPGPRRVAVVVGKGGGIGESTLRHLAEELGDEWSRLAYRLNIRHERQEAIRRAVLSNAGREEEMKYTMLITWLKRCPQAADKVAILSSALDSVGRQDLATELRRKERGPAKHVSLAHTTRSQT